MRLAEISVRKRKQILEYGREGKPFFCTTAEAVELILRKYPAGKLALFCDGKSFPALSFLARNRRVLTLVSASDDALPLFALPESVTCVIAVGNGVTFTLARYFAEVRRVGCVLLLREATCEGLYGKRASVRVGGERGTYPLAEADIFVDPACVEGVAEGYARLLLARLARFEGRALALLRGNTGAKTGAWMQVLAEGVTREEVLSAGMARAFAEGEAPQGEGVILAERLGGEFSRWRAYRQLLAIYLAGIKRGAPRPYFVPDYLARCQRAGVGNAGYLRAKIPTVEEYASRAIALEKTRGILTGELLLLFEQLKACRRTYILLGGKEESIENLEELRRLPEHAPEGLCAIWRDFGLI